ncbi:hypothetical protein [Streptomyces sp. NBC_00145]|uniref:hypothetical protein n=1 Tax=Streptomyces sp. NBC_00145 TaxID=2975666 RepID=UPI002E185670
MISLLFFTRSSLAEQDLSGRAGRNLAVRGESRGHQWGGKWPPMGSLSWPPSFESAQARWRAVNAPHLVALVRAGTRFERGHLVERPEAHAA